MTSLGFHLARNISKRDSDGGGGISLGIRMKQTRWPSLIFQKLVGALVLPLEEWGWVVP